MNHFSKTLPKGIAALFFPISLGIIVLSVPASFAHAAGSASIPVVSPSSSINVGKPVDFNVSTSGFTNPTFTVTDSFSGTSSIGVNTINEYSGYFGWTPIASDIGTHTLTVKVGDQLGDSATVSQTILVHASGSPYLSITNLTPSAAIITGQQITFFALASGYSTNPTYSVSDAFSGSSVNSSDITSNGEFIWTPTINDVGTHTITITGQDTLGESSTVQQTIVVTSSGSTVTATTITPAVTSSILSSSPSIALSISSLSGTNASVGERISFGTVSNGLTNPSYTLIDSFNGSTISNSDINSAGQFSWTPAGSDAGTHTIEIIGTDTSGHSASLNLQVVVDASSAVETSADTSETTPAPITIASSTPAFTFNTPLSLGLQSQDVTNLQTYLTQLGMYSGAITGYFGTETQTAVKSFQTAHGIDALGTVGPLTLAALNSSLTSTPNSTAPATSNSTATSTASSSTAGYTFSNLLSLGSTGADVTALQQKLTTLGMYSGPITGYFGTLTQSAVEQYQTANSISPVGYVGPSTRTALNG
jgi:peptidoglycan hydrolase-like protein with peptidoglycan-binding domain